MLEMKFLLISFRKMLSPFNIRHWELYTAPPSGIITKRSFRLANKNIIMSETVYDRRKLSDEHYYEDGIVKFRLGELLTAPPSSGMKMTSFLICKKIPLSRKWSVINTIWHSALKLTYDHFESWKYHDWSWKPKRYALLAIMSTMWVKTHLYRRHSAWPIIWLRVWPFILGSLCKLPSFS